VPYNKEAYEARKQSDPDYHRRRVYNLRYPDGDFDAYNSTTHCEICGRPLDPTGRQRKVQDHSHKTGKVRGVICHYCNTNLAYVDMVGISTLIKYYEEHTLDEGEL
jgi:hypothetical protein